MAAKFGLFVDEDHSKLPKLYWLPKLHKRPCKSRLIANSSACTTTELSILLTSCLTAIKNHVIKYCTTVYEINGKKFFWSIKKPGEILNKLKSRGFLASGLSTYDFSTLYTTLPHMPGRVAQSVTCLATDACLTAYPGVASSIPVRSHTFVEIDHEIISTVILLPSADLFKKGCCQLQAKVCARITG